MIFLVILSVMAGLISVSIPSYMNILVIIPIILINQQKNNEAIMAALIAGLIAETFSPWRLGIFTMLIIFTTLITYFINERVLPFSKRGIPVISFAFAVCLMSIPELFQSRDINAVALVIIETTLIGSLVVYFLDFLRPNRFRNSPQVFKNYV